MRPRVTYPLLAGHDRPARHLTGWILVLAVACLSSSLPPVVAVTRLTDLDFGNVASSDSKQILYSDAGAAAFRIDASGFVAQTQVAVSMTLPAQLSSGGNSVPVTFPDGAWSYTNSVAGATAFDPQTGTTIPKNGFSFSIYVWVGARITTTGATPQATYTNSLILGAEAL